MKLITYKSTWWMAWFWIEHAILVKDWYVLSYQMETILWKWEFFVYTIKEWKNSISEEWIEIEVPDFDILQYQGKQLEWLLCYEWLEVLFKENNIMFPDTIKIKTKALFIGILLLWLYTCIILSIWVLFWYYWFSVSEEEYLQSNPEICQE